MDGRPIRDSTGQRERRFVSPRARKVARQQGVDLDVLQGTGPGGRIVERDVVAALAASAERSPVSPIARRVAATLGVDPSTVRGTGVGGRVLAADVYEGRAATVAAHAATPARRGVGVASIAGAVTDEAQRTGSDASPGQVEPLTLMRRAIATRMSESAHSVARVTLFMDADATELVRMRSQLAAEFERTGARLSYDALVVRACALALRVYPAMNAEWVEEAGLLRHSRIHVGIAVALDPEGLVVPVVRDAAGKGLPVLAREINDLVVRARANHLQRDDMTGGTFTITNLGSVGVRAFTPIINPPQTGILGIGAIRDLPAYVDGRWERRSELTLSLSFDHRVIDGLPAARFLARVRELLQQPYALLIDL